MTRVRIVLATALAGALLAALPGLARPAHAHGDQHARVVVAGSSSWD